MCNIICIYKYIAHFVKVDIKLVKNLPNMVTSIDVPQITLRPQVQVVALLRGDPVSTLPCLMTMNKIT
jgi:hypothetical protein